MTADDAATAPMAISPGEPAVNLVSPESQRNWLVRHWRGEETLAVSYWRNSVLLGGFVPVLLMQIYSGVDPFHHWLRGEALAGVLIRLLRYVIWVWAIIGVLRSANHHTSRGGSLFWVIAARFIIGIAVTATALQLYNGEMAILKELAAIGTGHDPMPKLWVSYLKDGTAIWLQGTIGEGSAAEVERAFDEHTQIETVMLSSRGGRLAEAERIAALIKRRYLNTTVRGSCVSACTYILIAGHRRSASETSKIGFHQPSFPGVGILMQQSLTRHMTRYYLSAGLSQSFIAHVISTPHADMWYPTHSELWEAGVLNAESDQTTK
jgi:ATP-dependent protease ClpP protease subunit